jgi:hypothetical protein
MASSSSDDDQSDLVEKAKRLQQDIDDLKHAIRQGHQQHLDPKHLETMTEQLAKILKELSDLFD